PGQPISYTLVVQNNGPDDAPQAVLQDVFSPELTAVSWSCLGTACPAPSGTGDINATLTLSAGDVLTFTAVSTIDPATTSDTLSNTATITLLTSDPIDPSPANNSDTAVVTLTPQTSLTLTQRDAPDPVSAGSGLGNLTYAITVTNSGPSTASNVTVTHTLDLPTGVSLDGRALSTGAFGGGVWSIPSLAPNSTAHLTATLTVGAEAISQTNAITSTAVLNSVPHVQTTDIIRDIALLLTITEAADPVTAGSGAGNLVYRLTAENQGATPVSGVSVTATLGLTTGITLDAVQPDAASSWDGSTLWTVGNLNGGESRALTFTLTAARTVITRTQV
ncbi:MAG: DUF11 domain-containing protein, partial [Anaerolineales bacterium]|nr:DUF11 domain-containing protein [Anaerolineales bacterium]